MKHARDLVSRLGDPSQSGASHPRKVLLLGLDGLSDEFLKAPIVRESMPNLFAFLTNAARGPLMSVFPPYTAPAWTTITTGVHPGRHGIYSFTNPDRRPVSDSDGRSPRLWDYVGAAGGRSVIINVPMTYPPRAIEGVLVSGMPCPPGKSFTFPEELAPSLQELGYFVDVSGQWTQMFRPGLVQSRQVAEGGDTPLDELTAMTEARGRAAVQLAQTNNWDLFGVIFLLPDRLGHPWWKYLVPGDGHYETRQAERLRRGATRALRALDQAIGDVLAAMPSGTATVLCSDHGFGPLRGDVFFDLSLAKGGVIKAVPSRAREVAARLGRSRLGRLAPPSLHGWVKRRVAGEEPPKVRAWTAPVYESGVRLADAHDDEGRQLVTDLLLGLRDPEGRPIMKSVKQREEVYPGTDAPDILCVMEDESINLHEGFLAPDVWVSREDVAWGRHASRGVMAIQGAAATVNPRGDAADICPTILSLLGLKTDGLDGKSIVQADASQLVTVSADSVSGGGFQKEDAYSEDQEAAVLEHLRGLGYIE